MATLVEPSKGALDWFSAAIGTPAIAIVPGNVATWL
jgi:hypothetical protein